MKKNMNSYNIFGTILLALIFTANQAIQKTTVANKDVELQNIFANMYKNHSKEMETKAADLIKAGANPNLLVVADSPIKAVMPLLAVITRMPAIVHMGSKFRGLAKLLIEHGANINARDNLGRTPLMSAALGGRTDIAQLLIDAGVDVNAKGNEGNTPLILATMYGPKDIGMAELLIKAGANVNAKNNEGGAALTFATLSNRKNIAKLLIKAGADVNVKDDEGNTPLMDAIQWGHGSSKKDMAKLFIDAHADINVKNSAQETALDLAKKAGDADIIKMLQDAQKTEKKGEK